MVQFIEYRRRRVLIALITVVSSLIVPLLTAVLFIRETITTAGFCIICGLGVLGSTLIQKWIEHRSRTITEIMPGKTLKAPQEAGKSHSNGLFRERFSLSFHILLVLFLGVMGLLLIGWALMSDRSIPRLQAFLLFLMVVPVLLLVVAVSRSQSRLEIQGDRVLVKHPLSGSRNNREFAFHFHEIERVEVKEMDRGVRQVRIVLQDGSDVLYYSENSKAVTELVETLKRGVAEAKPGPSPWSELA